MIGFERCGGAAGVTLRASLASEELTPAEAQALAMLLAEPPGPVSRPDRFQYRLRLPEGEVVVPESLVPDPLRDLFSRLVDRARSAPD